MTTRRTGRRRIGARTAYSMSCSTVSSFSAAARPESALLVAEFAVPMAEHTTSSE
ncbi:hypothetical protein ACOCJ7_17580 [Knoellia sp. CPCC 206453]|uniref:hypothetical protein n=1 Tax=Knoellia pratensis TaxID=3404796 RepID=UPI0036140D46